MRRTTRAVLAAALTAGLAGTLLPAATAAPEELRFRDLDRGDSAAVPYLEGDVLVDGDRRIELPRIVGGLLGTSGDDYLVWAFTQGGAKDKVLRVSPDGSREIVLRARALYDADLSPDGTSIATSVSGRSRRTTVKTYDTTTGDLTGRRTLTGYGNVLDYDGDVVALGLDSPGKTVAWTPATDRIEKVVGKAGFRADLGSDRLAVLTKDPYRGGCTVVSTFSDPGTELWRSCRERVEAWSTDGSRMATVDLLADGLGPGRAWLRRIGGRLLGAYDAPFYFGRISFEDATHVLMDTYSDSLYAVVRCDSGGCERASRLYGHNAPMLPTRVPFAGPS